MDRGKKLDVSVATIVDLKAELFRKREESKQDQNKQHGNVSGASLKLGNKIRAEACQLGKPNPGLQLRLAKDNESRIIDEGERDALSRSRQKLEEKSRLYDKLTRESLNADEEDDTYMVDFQRKALNKFSESKSATQTGNNDEFLPVDETSDDWVDYTDSLGRSRKCLRQDLPRMVEMDIDLQKRNPAVSSTDLNLSTSAQGEGGYKNMAHPSFVAPMTEAETQPVHVPLGPVHYQNVQHNEIRSHGTGYFAFSQSETERKEQMETLSTLRDQTNAQRIRNEKLKEKRKLILAARLAKVKQRKKMQSGAVSSSDSAGDSDEEFIGPTLSTEKDGQDAAGPAVVEDKKKIDPPAPVRPWDRGKIGVLSTRIAQPFKKASQKEWVDEERDRRPNEFAPPTSYYAGGSVNREKRPFEFAPPPTYHADKSFSRNERLAQFAPPQSYDAGDPVGQSAQFSSDSKFPVGDLPNRRPTDVVQPPHSPDDPVERMHLFFKQQADMMSQVTRVVPCEPPSPPSVAFMRSVPPPMLLRPGFPPQYPPPMQHRPMRTGTSGADGSCDALTPDTVPSFDLSEVPLPPGTGEDQR